MVTKLLLLVLTILVGLIVVLFARARWARFSIVDLYVSMIAAFFIAYTFVDAALNALNDFSPGLSILALLLVVVITVLTWMSVQFLPANLLRTMEFRYLIKKWTIANNYALLALFGGLLVFKLYGFLQFGILTRISSIDLNILGIVLPYWFTSINVFLQPLLLTIFIASLVKVLHYRRIKQLGWLFLLCLSALLFSLMGRRSFFFLIVLGNILFIIQRKYPLFSFKTISVVITSSIFMLIFSNVFQNYRSILNLSNLYQPTILPSFFNTLSDTDSTVENLRIRQSMWQFNYMVLDAQGSEMIFPPTFGQISWQALRNSIPRVIYPNKSVYDLDEMVATIYRLPVRDYPTNIFAVFQADYGLLSVFLLPVYNLCIFFVMSILLSITNKFPTLFLLVSGRFIYYILNVEESSSAPIILFRDIGVIVIIFYTAYFLLSIINKRGRFDFQGI